MLIYSKEPLNIMMKNILLLDDPFTNGYVYVSKETFEQALSLSITFNQDVKRVRQTISGKGMLNWDTNKAVNNAVNVCSEHFVSPLNMLAPYLAYTLPIGVEWPEDNEEVVRMAYGVLHQMSQFINFYGTALMPAGSKADITIPKNIIMSYEDSWKAQLETLDKCVVTIPVYVEKEVQVSTPTPVPTPAPVVEDIAPAPIPVAEVKEEIPVPDFVPTEENTEENTEAAIIDEAPTEESAESASEEESTEESDDDLEARILAMMKAIEEAPAEDYLPKEDSHKDERPIVAEKEKEPEVVNYGESGSINLTESEIAEGNRRLLNDYDI